METSGLHHVTAITARAAENLRFYTNLLGMRLVKKTVNQDDVSAYHLFYADRLGSPGTDLTFFDWASIPPSQPGAGAAVETALRVPGPEALAFWASRLSEAGVPHSGITQLAGRARITFTDPEGQALALVDDTGAPGGGQPWERAPVPAACAIRGLSGVTLRVRDLSPSAAVLTSVLGFREIGPAPASAEGVTEAVLFESGAGGPGAQVIVEAAPRSPRAQQGAGGVHHVAFRAATGEEQRAWRAAIFRAGLQVTDVIDRYYFQSIYFREPGGVLFEIATDGPGFTGDEDAEHLGERLSLPPFLEPHRSEIEASLKPL